MAIMRPKSAPRGRAMPAGGSMVGGARPAPARAMPVGGSRVGGRRFAEGGDTKKPTKSKKPVNPEEGDLNPFGPKTPKILESIKKEGKKMAKGGKCYAKGGYVSAADGCVSSGRTKGRFV